MSTPSGSLPPVDLPAAVRGDPLLTDLAARADRAGVELLLVGGAVRDFLLKFTPRDYDFVLAAPPETATAFLNQLADAHRVRLLTFDKKGIRERLLKRKAEQRGNA